MHKLTEYHFDYWVECCRAWVKYFGLIQWEIHYSFQEASEDSPKASCSVEDFENRLVVLYLFNDFDSEPKAGYLNIVAFHEVMELFLSDIHMLAISREWSALEYDKEHHRIIRTLEKVVYPELKDKIDVPVFQPPAKKKKRKGSKVS